MRKFITTVALATLLIGTGSAAPARAANYWSDFGVGVGAVATNVLYFPAKLVYATVGGVVGGIVYGLTAGNSDAAQMVWSPTMGGTWVVTPEMLRGEQPFLYAGESYDRERKR